MDYGHLKITVLNILSKNSLSGYDLMKQIGNALGKKPSPGSMYPLLKGLKEKGLIIDKKKDRRTIYTLTEKGKVILKEILKNRDEMFNNLQKTMNFMHSLIGKDKKEDFLTKIFNRIKKGKAPFVEFTDEMIKLRDVMLSITDKNLNSEKKKQILEVLKKTNKEINKICSQ